MPVNMLPQPDAHAGRMAELDALLARVRARVAKRTSCAICSAPLVGKQKSCCGARRCQKEAMRRRTAALREQG